MTRLCDVIAVWFACCARWDTRGIRRRAFERAEKSKARSFFVRDLVERGNVGVRAHARCGVGRRALGSVQIGGRRCAMEERAARPKIGLARAISGRP